ncbi:DEAD/DEAH box helicase [Pseudomonas sp. KFB-139]|uniref:DEAD/DEAH box helicase n=1 Tax=Pseudomonas serbiensis TaxID=3064350 RepID=A0ABT9CU91_9PSED|nr:DEAD/DEAH box helicase [Pseudomonas sp. KFB-138]MDO7929070.1 DEAD/DEAH box helicase [Pseudomonas sp. KFB-138]
MSTFATELASRFVQNQEFRDALGHLQACGAASALPGSVKQPLGTPDHNAIGKMLYCASVFAQSGVESHVSLAQTIAFNAMLISQESTVLERCATILTEIGNFPSLSYAEKRNSTKPSTLLGMIQRNIVEQLNTVEVAGSAITLTDYQRKVWDSLQEGRSLAISAPTSAGKSFLVIEHLCRDALALPQFVFVYIAPTRALLSEVHLKIKERLASDVNIRVTDIPTFENVPRQIFVLTQERFKVLLSITSSPVNFLVVDEAQNLSDGARGMILQDCIEQCYVRDRKTHVVLLAPGAQGFTDALESLGIPGIPEVSTTVSPVLQNRIVVSKTPSLNQLDFKLLSAHGYSHIGTMSCKTGLNLVESKLAAVALELGSGGGSLVYAKTPTEAASIAGSIALGLDDVEDAGASDLAEFIKDHIHRDYHLIGMVKKGVAFHYGQMPALLREAIESAFRAGTIKFLVCTTTLFQGINLPARNVFINTPARGRGEKVMLDPALLWNFAGRAGRMAKDIVGNVFLIDYDDWNSQPMDTFYKFTIRSALSEFVTDNAPDVLAVLKEGKLDSKLGDERTRNATASAGMLVSKARQGAVGDYLIRVAPSLDYLHILDLKKAAEKASEELLLPQKIIEGNWTLDLFALDRLMAYLVERINDGTLDGVVPKSPADLGKAAFGHYKDIFNILFKYIKGFDKNFGSYVSRIAVRWMEGKPYPFILNHEIASEKRLVTKKQNLEKLNLSADSSYKVKKIADANPSKVIKKAFDTIEDVVRFQLVQMGKAYNDILIHVFNDNGLAHRVSEIFDFALALELGVSTNTGRAFLELGLSRIAASELQKVFPNSDLNISSAREKLLEFDPSPHKLSPVILTEIDKVKAAIATIEA